MATTQVQRTPRPQRSWRRQQLLTQIALYVVLSLAAVIVIFPFYYMIITSLREAFYRFNAMNVDLLPSAFNLEGYRRVFSATAPGSTYAGGSMLLNGLKNTLLLEVAIVLGSTVFNGCAAYAFAKHDFPGRNLFFTIFLTTIILPGEVTLVTKYVMFHRWGILNTYWALILPSLTGIFGIFLMRQFMSTIPDAYLEAARIDGASELDIVARIIFPLSMPVLATYALFTFLGVWNDLMGPLMFLSAKPAYWTLTLSIYYFVAMINIFNVSISDPDGISVQKLFAGLILSALPTVAVFVVFQKRLAGGITLTGLKG
jgi:multiple sugar transport system permease protein